MRQDWIRTEQTYETEMLKSKHSRPSQVEQQPPRPLTLEQTPHFLPLLPLLPCRHLTAQLLRRRPGPQATPESPVTMPSCRVTRTWPPLLWWLQQESGCPQSLEEEKSGNEKRKFWSRTANVDSKKGHEDTTRLPQHFVLVQALVCQLRKTDLSVKERHLIFISHAVWSNRICNSHQGTGAPFSEYNLLRVHFALERDMTESEQRVTETKLWRRTRLNFQILRPECP